MLYGKTYRPGRGCSFCMFSYAVPRFFWEFLRYHDENYRFVETNGLFGLSMTQILCIAGIVLGIVWLFVLPLEKRLMEQLWAFVARRRQPGK